MISTSWFWPPFGSHFGGVLGAQMEAKAIKKPFQKNIKKNDTQNELKLVPKGIPKWSQNRQKWGLGSILFQGWLPSSFQTPSRIDFGEVWASFWEQFRHFVHICCWICGRARKQHVANRDVQNHQESSERSKQRGSEKQLLVSCHLASKSSLANVNELSGPC